MKASLALALLEGAPKSAAEGRLALFGDYFLADPWSLALVPVGLLLVLRGRGARARAAGRIPCLPAALPRSLPQRLGWLPVACEVLALCLLALALARPLRGSVHTTSESEGIDIVLALDRSGSMQFDDLEPKKSRLEVVKEVVGDFALRRMSDREGAADRIALLSFAAYPRLACPFTLDVDAVKGFLAEIELAQTREEDGTAIGVALAKAVAVLKESDARSKVVVLLTDGENNIDLITPAQAAELAAESGVRVHTVFAGRYVYTTDVFGRARRLEREIDTRELRAIAERTGGRFFRAKDRQALEEVYAEIERLERTPRHEERWTESYDLYLGFVLAALGAWLAAWLSWTTWARRLA